MTFNRRIAGHLIGRPWKARYSSGGSLRGPYGLDLGRRCDPAHSWGTIGLDCHLPEKFVWTHRSTTRSLWVLNGVAVTTGRRTSVNFDFPQIIGGTLDSPLEERSNAGFGTLMNYTKHHWRSDLEGRTVSRSTSLMLRAAVVGETGCVRPRPSSQACSLYVVRTSTTLDQNMHSASTSRTVGQGPLLSPRGRNRGFMVGSQTSGQALSTMPSRGALALPIADSVRGSSSTVDPVISFVTHSRVPGGTVCFRSACHGAGSQKILAKASWNCLTAIVLGRRSALAVTTNGVSRVGLRLLVSASSRLHSVAFSAASSRAVSFTWGGAIQV
jgi:hypothetical protein